MYDIIIAGGGVAGCVIAGTLSSADPSLKILLLEAGAHSLNNPTHVQPARYWANLQNANKKERNLTLHVSQPSDALLGRSITVPAGRVLGGGSAVNFMVYTRASASDYDAWEFQFGNEGWGSRDLIPLLNGAETYHPYNAESSALDIETISPKESGANIPSNRFATNGHSTNGNTHSIHNVEDHGDSGPLQISFEYKHINLAEQFLEVAAKYDHTRAVGHDFNDFHSGDKYARWPKYIDPKTGTRSDAAHHFVYNLPQNPNLVIETQMRVIRVLFEGTKAVGVEYIDAERRVKQAFASRQVVLSAGSFGSPAILERSGIGSLQVLQKNGIKQLVDLPGVGEHYMDHSLIFTQYHASGEAETLENVFNGTEAELVEHESEWLASGTGLMRQNGLNSGCKIRPTSQEVQELSPVFQKRWTEFFAHSPDKPLMLAGIFSLSAASPEKTFALLYYSAYPASIGRTHIAGGLDPYAPLNYHPGYLDHEADLDAFRWAYKHCREIARRMPFYRGEQLKSHPVFPEGSRVACNSDAGGPVPVDAPKLQYSREDDKAIDDFHRRTMGTAWHAAGTCAMKAREAGGVVSSRLGVYGTTNLKVADLSICPENVGANTYNTALAVGLKAASIIAKDIGEVRRSLL